MRELTNSKTRRTWILLLTGFLLSAALGAVYLAQSPFVSALTNRTTDSVMALSPGTTASGSVIIVDIDEKSLATYGQWPWPRSLLAQLLDPIAAAGPAAISLDLILAEPDRASQNPPHSDSDLHLARTLAKGPYVLGYAFSFRGVAAPRQECTLHPPGIVLVNIPERGWDALPLFTARGVTCNLPSFSNTVRRSGFLNATPDGDGVLRRVPTLIRFQDGLYPSFALATLMQYAKKDQIELMRGRGTHSIQLSIGNKAIPIDRYGNLRIRFFRGDITPRVSASEILAGRFPVGQLSKKIVLVGSSAAGLEPVFVTAGGELHTPSEVHAHVLENLLAGQWVVRTSSFRPWEVVFGIALAAVAALAVAYVPLLPAAGVCLALAAGAVVGSVLVFENTGYLFSPLLPAILVLLDYSVLTIVRMWLVLAEKQQLLEKVNQSLEQRVADAVADLRNKDQLLIQQGRQAAMGEMISNIAHQWRQPLNMLGLIVQELRLTYGRPEFNKETLDASVAKAMKQIQHMSQTIEDFRSYFKPDKEKSAFPASLAVKRTLALVDASLRASEIEIQLREKESVEVFGYPNEYSQVLLNILLNCRDAFEEAAAEKKRTVAIEIYQEEGRSVVTITDNAGGIPEVIISKIFDPYFTTKAPDKGTGIGLYMAKMIIEKNMGGKLDVRNTAEGAQFRIEV